MSKMNIKVGDTVKILTGDDKDRNQTGKVLEVSPSEGKVIVEKHNIVTKHVKPRRAGDPSGIIKAESAIYACKVQLVCPKCKQQTRVGRKVNENGKKVRVCAKCKAEF